jgi:hypothetical protein
VDRLGRRAEDAVALIAVAVGAFLRFDGLGTPSYWLDEILHQNVTTIAMAQPWWRWLIGFERENGPLYYLTQLAARLFGRSEFAGRLFPALFGVAAIVLVWLVRRDGIAAMLLAVSPLAVYFSREARPYSLLAMLAAALIVLLLRGRTWATCAAIVATLYAGAMGAPIVAGALIVALLLRQWWVAGVAAGAFALFPLLYRTNTHVTGNTPFPSLDPTFALTLMRNFSVTALDVPVAGRAAVAMFTLVVVGAVVLARRERRTAIVVIGMTAVPLAVTLGALWKFEHWYGPRYIVPCTAGYALLAGCGIEALTRRFKPAALVIAALFAWQAWPAVRTEAWQKLDWRAIADKLVRYARPGDVIVAGEQWSEAGLRYYLRGRVRLEGIPYAPVAQAFVNGHPHCWLVSDVNGSNATRQWMCGFPVVLTSALDRFRVHYTGDFLRERAGPAEWRAVSAAMGAHALIDLTTPQNRFLDSGWAGPEGFRWAVGTHASVTFPRWGARDRSIRMRLAPMDYPKLLPQTLRASLNGQPIGTMTLAAGWSERALVAPARAWRDGMNTLAFDFGRAAAPADLDPRATDHRPLAVAFEWIAVDDKPGPANPHAYAVRIASAPFIDENSAWRGTRTHLPPAPPPLAGRLGFDPLVASRVHLEDMVESVAYGSDCEDDHAFLQRAFESILDRPPDQHEERALAKVPRERVPVRLTKSEEFRRSIAAAVSGRP